MGSNFITPDEHSQYPNEDIGVLKCEIAMGRMGFIVYSYTMTALQILEALSNKLSYIAQATPPARCNFSDSVVYVDGVNVNWSYALIENIDDHFGAVILYLVSVRGDETDDEWKSLVHRMTTVSTYMDMCIKIEGASVEKIDFPEKKSFEDKGFYFVHSEVADAFRNSIKLQEPYTTMLKDNAPIIPTWYKTGNPAEVWGNGILSGSTSNTSGSGSTGGGCYIATTVYGSYDCPEVWTLRRYRDYELAEHWYGRAFIHVYYTLSPLAVKLFGHTAWFKKVWKSRLDVLVRDLQNKGIESTYYEDKHW
ncbi:MAG: hypothetical protein J6O61_14490 [Butyrivibrio sp.]|uniref:CFI-box-CTERM domain-containing protein n=1 Tax=Butyrivibrio sp. TaxID=28121 RepID=UPI001B254917|nr:CFI-box-CTERM domain-containing protein [Butyrivibrio sp.]MBO6242010.1 hypothetical protein [Butyrivibrio sp.]